MTKPHHELDPFQQRRGERLRMVEQQLARRDIDDERVLAAMRRVPRHCFMPAGMQAHAYDDRPLSIGCDQTISQPYVVALMTQLARPRPDAIALDVGTGSGYQAAILAELCRKVISLEIIRPLAERARQLLADLGYANVEVHCADAFGGWSDEAPYDLIIAAAAPLRVPQSLLDQLAVDGRLVMPIGYAGAQDLILVERQANGRLIETNCGGVAFVPMTGEAGGRA